MIQIVETKVRIPSAGKIRLGIRSENEGGYPQNKEYFVLTDAPDVEAVYGKEPKELDIMFLDDPIMMPNGKYNFDDLVPTWLKMFGGGFKNKNGDFEGGKCLCKGNGPDENGVPGVAEHFAVKDPVTRVVPRRPCAGENCPDWLNTKGEQQCKYSMKMIVFLPLVALQRQIILPYEIDTTSKIAVQNIYNSLNHMANVTNGRIAKLPFKLYREEVALEYYDKRSDKLRKTKPWCMNLSFNQKFAELNPKFHTFLDNVINSVQGVDRKAIAAGPMEDNYALTHKQLESGEIVPLIEAKRIEDKEYAESPELMPLFEALAKALGKENTAKGRLLTVKLKQFEALEGPSKVEAIKVYLMSKMPSPADTPAKQTHVPDSEGLI